MWLAEHLGDLSQELLSTPGKDARQQVRPRSTSSRSPHTCRPRWHTFCLEVWSLCLPLTSGREPVSGQTKLKAPQLQVLDFSHT